MGLNDPSVRVIRDKSDLLAGNFRQLGLRVVRNGLTNVVQHVTHFLHGGVELGGRFLVLEPSMTFQIALNAADDFKWRERRANFSLKNEWNLNE